MTANLNTNVFFIRQDKDGLNYIDFTDEFDELTNVLHTVLNKWNEVQCRNTAAMYAKKQSAQMLLAMAETLEACCRKALENHHIPR